MEMLRNRADFLRQFPGKHRPKIVDRADVCGWSSRSEVFRRAKLRIGSRKLAHARGINQGANRCWAALPVMR